MRLENPQCFKQLSWPCTHKSRLVKHRLVTTVRFAPKPVGPGVEHRGIGQGSDAGGQGAADQDQGGHRQDVEGHEGDLASADLLAQVLRGSPDHQAGEEDREDGQHEDPVEAWPTPPGDTSPSIMLSRATPPPSRGIESCMEFTAPVEVPVVDTANSAEAAVPEADLLALHRRTGRRGRRAPAGAAPPTVR